MTHAFRRVGELKDLASYPLWLQQVVRETRRDKARVVGHEVYALMRDARLPPAAMQRFMMGGWSTIEQFPQFMAMNLEKIRYGKSPGEDLARRYLMHNIRVEQKHADHWLEWARAVGLDLADLDAAEGLEGMRAMAHWCWYVCSRENLAVAVAATNYAIEGATGEWSCIVCSRSTYAESLAEDVRAPAMRWLRLHAEYDDTHPWEALEIVATLLGHEPPQAEIDAVRTAIRRSYAYMELALDQVAALIYQGTFDETASNASTLGLLDAA